MKSGDNIDWASLPQASRHRCRLPRQETRRGYRSGQARHRGGGRCSDWSRKDQYRRI